MGGLKNNWFLKQKLTFCLVGPRGEWGCRSQKRHLWWAADSGYSQAACHFNDGVCWAFGFPWGCPPINSILCLLLHFSYCVFSESFFCFFFLLCFLLLFLSEALEPFCWWFLCLQPQPFFFRFPLGTCILRVFFPLLRLFVCWLRSCLFGQAACDCVKCWYLLVF